MADWYVSSVAYAALPQFAISTAYSVGQIIRPLTTPAFSAQHVFRCTTAGTSGATEPTWTGANVNNNTLTSGTAVFTNVTGQSAYGWSAAAGNLYSITGSATGGARPVGGDRTFLSSDHTETSTGSVAYQLALAATFAGYWVISVNRAGSVPPGIADFLAGATISSSGGNITLDAICDSFYNGVVFSVTAANAMIQFNSGSAKVTYLKNCALILGGSTGASAAITSFNPGRLVLDNTTMQFSNVGQGITMTYMQDFVWLNTPAAIQGATIPTSLIRSGPSSGMSYTLRGVDLSALTTTILASTTAGFSKILLDSCRIASGVIRLGTPTVSAADEVELVNCFDGTSILSERHTAAGDVTTEFSTTLLGGAQDDVGLFSHKMASSIRSDLWALTLDGFWFDVESTLTTGSHTATVEIISSATLNNTDITLTLQYQGTTGSSFAALVSSASVLTAASALFASTATWNNPPATPVKQYLQVTFAPRQAGRVRGQVRLGKPSTTVWVNPQLTIV